jgi:hypothetical protein
MRKPPKIDQKKSGSLRRVYRLAKWYRPPVEVAVMERMETTLYATCENEINVMLL